MHSIPGMILLSWPHPFYNKGVFGWDIVTFVRFIHEWSSELMTHKLCIAGYLGKIENTPFESMHLPSTT